MKGIVCIAVVAIAGAAGIAADIGARKERDGWKKATKVCNDLLDKEMARRIRAEKQVEFYENAIMNDKEKRERAEYACLWEDLDAPND